MKNVTITALSTNGEGIARDEGKVIFVPFTLPGETWEIELVESKKKFSRGHPQRLIHSEEQPAIKRTAALCPYYTQCGGCQIQHIPYTQQLELKQQWLEETFQRVGHIEIHANPVLSANEWEYRNKTTFSLVVHQDEIVLANHTINLPNLHIPIEDCMISHPLIRQALPVIKQLLRPSHLKLQPYRSANQPGSRITLRVWNDRLAVYLHDVTFIQPQQRWFESLNNAVQKEMPGVLMDDNKAYKEIFTQINHPVSQRLYDWVCRLPFQHYSCLLDGYCGMGELTHKLSLQFQHTDGVEINKQAIQSAQSLYGSENVSFYAQPLEEFLMASKQMYDVTVFNPPRAGLSAFVLEYLAKHLPVDAVMISCHPAALARDSAELLQFGYVIQSVQPFDMFPQTHHLETVVHYKKQ